MKLSRAIIIVSLLLVLAVSAFLLCTMNYGLPAGTVRERQVRQIRIGMSEVAVNDILGVPNRIVARNANGGQDNYWEFRIAPWFGNREDQLILKFSGARGGLEQIYQRSKWPAGVPEMR